MQLNGKVHFSLGYNLSNTGRKNCKKGQEGPQGIELKIGHCSNPNSQKKEQKWKLDAPTVIVVKYQYAVASGKRI